MARMPGQGVAASVGGPTTPGAATTEVQEQGVPPPPPGLHPLDFSNWSLPFPEAPLTGGLSTPSGGLPGIGRQTAGPWASGQKAPALPMQVPSAPQGMLHHTNRLCSHPGGQQEGACWPDLPQTEPLLHPTKPSLTMEGNRPGDGASEADQPVAPEGAEG